jgi:hypothetical protein
MFTLTIETDNDAFDADPREEVARLLEVTAAKLRAGHEEGRCVDSNGNRVGRFELTPPAPTCPECGDVLTDRVERDGRPSYCDTCDREVG